MKNLTVKDKDKIARLTKKMDKIKLEIERLDQATKLLGLKKQIVMIEIENLKEF